MDAVILAAGLGTRLRPHTLKTPKPLLEVQGRPILDWIVGALPPEVNRLVVVVSYLAEQVEEYLAVRRDIPNGSPLCKGSRGTGDALKRCQSQVHSDRFLVLNGDDLFGAADIAQLAQCPAGVLVQTVEEPRRFGIAFLKEDGSLEKLVEKPDLDGPRLANTGAYLFPRGVFDIPIGLSPRGEYEITDYVSALAESGRVEVVEAKFWFPIGTEEAWNRAQTLQIPA